MVGESLAGIVGCIFVGDPPTQHSVGIMNEAQVGQLKGETRSAT